MKRICVVLLFAAAFGSCISATRARAADPPTEADVIDVLWRYHTSVVRSGIAPQFSINGDDFARSVQFLEKITSIYSDTPNWAGRIPTEELPNTLRRWDEWYKKHGGELRLSQDGCSLVLQSSSHLSETMNSAGAKVTPDRMKATCDRMNAIRARINPP